MQSVAENSKSTTTKTSFKHILTLKASYLFKIIHQVHYLGYCAEVRTIKKFKIPVMSKKY